MDDTKDFMMELLVERNQLRAALTRMQQHANEAEERRRRIVDQLNTLQCVHSTVASELVITMGRLEDIQDVIASRHIAGQTEYETILQICQDLDGAEAKLAGKQE